MSKSHIHFTFEVNGGNSSGMLEIHVPSGENIRIAGFAKGTSTNLTRPDLGDEVRCAVIDANSAKAIKLIKLLVSELKGEL